MKEIIEKISSYNLFNYLFPGILFSALLKEFTSYSLIKSDVLVSVFIYYFVGLIISRFGSLVIEPILKKISFIKFIDYKEFVEASKKDTKIELFSEINNTYRTLVSLFIILLIMIAYNNVEIKYAFLKELLPYVLSFSLLVLFLLSYKKQTNYIYKRTKSVL